VHEDSNAPWDTHGMRHDGMVLSGVQFIYMWPAFTILKHLVVGWARRVLARARVALLCWLVHRLYMCLFVQHDGRCRQLLFCLRGYKLHNGEMSCLRMYFFL
jgi:hypothetical protein